MLTPAIQSEFFNVYRIDKEVQLLNPSPIENIFLGLGASARKKSQYPVTSKSVELEVHLLRMIYSVLALAKKYIVFATYVAKKGRMMLAETLQKL